MKNTMKNTAQNVRITAIASLGAVFLLGLIASGCTDENDEVDGISNESSALSTPAGDGQMRGFHKKTGRHDRRDGSRKMLGRRGGRHGDAAGMLIKAALRQDSLTPEQRQTIEALAPANRASRMQQGDSIKAAFRSTLAQSVRDGKIDTEAWNAHFETMAAKREAHRAARVSALNTLYTTLNPDQRAAVVAAVKTSFEAQGAAFNGRNHRGEDGRGFEKGMHGKRRHEKGSVARRMNGDGPAMETGFCSKHDRGGHHGKGGFGMLTGLDLSETQQTAVAALRQNRTGMSPDKTARNADRAAMKQCRVDFLDGFASEHFDAAARCTNGIDENRSAKMTARLDGFQKLLSILTEQQRNQLADRLEAPRM